MKTCLNTITLGRDNDFPRVLSAISRAGFQGVELFSIEEAQEFAGQRSIGDLRSLLSRLSLEVVGFILGGFAFADNETYGKLLPEIKDKMAIAGDIDASNALLFLPPVEDMPEEEAIELAVERIGETADTALDYNLTISLEPIGKAPFLNTPSRVLRLIEEVGARNLEITIDLFHYFTAGCPSNELREIPVGYISLIHVNDVPDLPLENLTDSERVLPGEGRMDLSGYISTLHSIGYTDFLSVELFNQDLWDQKIEDVCIRAKNMLERVMDQAGV